MNHFTKTLALLILTAAVFLACGFSIKYFIIENHALPFAVQETQAPAKSKTEPPSTDAESETTEKTATQSEAETQTETKTETETQTVAET